MAGTVTLTEEVFGSIKKLTFAWVSSAGGLADKASAKVYNGEILRAVQIPDGGGTQPTNLYDVTVEDDDGADVLLGLGADLVNTANTDKVAKDGLGVVANAVLTCKVTNAGNAKGGKTVLYIR
ncbi:hypothetical protein LCGC14_1731380 [marine sediment metagenome]|uniref:Uncharacterized protein n=1 Tax=marine sediment metagenome TaxID=412755 RepID=A0A0F9K960_9ZZZZ